MKITESKLRQIILEEIQIVELEELLISEAAAMGITLTEEQKKSILQRLGKSARKYGAGLALGAGLAAGGAGLHGLQSDYEQGIKDQIAQNMAAAEERAQDPAYIESKLREQLGNELAWTWNTTGDKEDRTPFPGVQRQSDGSYAPYGGTGGVDWKIALKKGDSVQAVYPPDWSVLQQVFMDFKSGGGPQILPEDVVSPTGQTDVTEFFDSQVWQQGDIKSTSHGAPYQGSKFISFDSLPDDYQLPLSGKSKSEYYVQLWDDYIGY